MKQLNIPQLFFTTILIPACQLVSAQCIAPTVAASGPTALCAGNSVTLSAQTGNGWAQKANIGGTRRLGAVGFAIGNKGYLGTGRDNFTGPNRKDFWEYDPATNVWTQKADFASTARSYATGFSIGSKGYIGTGNAGDNTKDFWEYDPATNAWSQRADFGGTARSYAAGFSIGSKGYIGTGNSNTATKDFWEYDPATDVWTRKADFGGTARYGTASFSTGGKGYVGTGFEGVNIFAYTKDFWAYDPATNTWTQKADFKGNARGYAASFSIGSKGYIGTGSFTFSGRSGSLNFRIEHDFWEYNTATDVWTQTVDYAGYERDRTISFTIGGKGYIGFGRSAVDEFNGVGLPDFWEYDPGSTYVWSPGGATTASITVSTTGNYSVVATNAAGCSATSAVVNVRAFSSATVYVDGSRNTPGDGASWATAFTELSDALDLANHCTGITQILVAKGTYKPTSNGTRDSSFTILRGGLKLYGGYPSGGGNYRNMGYNPTLLSGDIGLAGNDADNSYHVLVIAGLGSSADSLILDGFTITKGKADGSNFRMYSNTNIFQSAGSGVVITASNAAGNKVVIRNCAVTGNSSADDAGGIYCRGSSPLLVNCVVTGNSSGRWGGGMLSLEGSIPRVINCTFASNSAIVGGAICVSEASAVITNSIVWGNSATSGAGVSQIADAASVVTYSDVQGGKLSGAGNKSVNPLFINPANPAGPDGNFGSWDDGLIPWPFIIMPAVNAGSNAAVPAGITTDIRGWARIKEGRVDLGAYEYQDYIGSILGLSGMSTTATVTEEGMTPLKVYPVPARDMVWVTGNRPGLVGKQMQLTDMHGSVLQNIRISQWPQRIDVSALPSGVYLLRLPDKTIMKVIRQ